MMKFLIAISIVVLTTGCSFVPYFKNEVNEIKAEFDAMYGVELPIKIEFVDIISIDKPNPLIAGVCRLLDRKIEINTNTYWSFSKAKRKALIWHELGHCILFRQQHDLTLMKDGCPDSFMYPIIDGLTSSCLDDHEDHYERELFGRL